MLRRIRRANTLREQARAIHAAIVARSRAPVFYTRFGVPDTIDGRFDVLTMHAFLAMESFNGGDPGNEELSTLLATEIFAGFEEGLRELGVGDIGLGRRMKALANAFYGRLEVYRAAGDVSDLARALARNLYRGGSGHDAEAHALARYMISIRRRWASSGAAAFSENGADFGPLPEFSR